MSWMKPSRTTAAVAAGALVALFLPLAGSAVASHGNRYLDVNPETSKAALRARVQMSATLKDPATQQASQVNAQVTINFEVDGPGDPSGDGPDFSTPDLTCNIKAGSSGCRKGYANIGGTTGDDTIWAWIGDTALDQTEGLNGKTMPGVQAEPDGTDLIGATWFAGLPATGSLNCNPDTSIVQAGSAKTFTCTVQDQSTNPATRLSGWEIDAENLSPSVNDPDNSSSGNKTADYDGADAGTACVTNGSGQCAMTIPSETPGQAGLAHICFWVDEENDQSFHPPSVEWDGGLCDTETAGAPENDNRTDVVALSWKLHRTISLKSSKSSVKRGKTFRLSGAIKRTTTGAAGPASTCRGSQTVIVRRDVLRDGKRNVFSKLKSVKSGPQGRYHTMVTGRKSARYKTTLDPGSRCYKAASSPKTVRVHR